MKKMILLFVVAMVAMACQKDELPVEPGNPTEPEVNYYPLTVGSYWVYQMYKIDSSGVENEINRKDSTIITGDTIINGKTYSVFEKNNSSGGNSNFESEYYIRDSSGYIVGNDGSIVMSFFNFTDTLSQGEMHANNNDPTSPILFSYSSIMETVENPISVPAGDFEVINHKSTIFANENFPVTNPRYSNTYYSDGVGQILRTNFFINTDRFEFQWRLTDYFIAP